MFGLNNKKQIQTPTESADELSIAGVTMHTMSDDLGLTEGNVPAPQIQAIRPVVIESKKEEAANFQPAPGQVKTISSLSPFLNSAGKEKDKGGPSIDTPQNKEGNKPKTPSPADQSSKKSSTVWLMATMAFLIIMVFGLGGYYFWVTRNIKKAEENVPAEEVVAEEPINEPVVIKTEEPKFALDKPNYLRLDVLTSTPEVNQKIFADKAAEIAGENVTVPVEFTVVDKDNNPVPFSLFASLAGITLPKAIMDSLESYSIYFYSDYGNMRMGLDIKIEEGMDISKLLLREEANLVEDLKPVILGNITTTEKVKFEDGVYKNFAVRYFKLNPENTLSVSYAIVDNSWVIGTSKYTIWAILDKQ